MPNLNGQNIEFLKNGSNFVTFLILEGSKSVLKSKPNVLGTKYGKTIEINRTIGLIKRNVQILTFFFAHPLVIEATTRCLKNIDF